MATKPTAAGNPALRGRAIITALPHSLAGMIPRIGRIASRLGGLALALSLIACSSAPSRTPASIVQSIETKAADGSFEGAWDAAKTFETFNDPRAVTWYARAAAVTPWSFHNPQAEEALGRIWTDVRCCMALARTSCRAQRCAPHREKPSGGTALPPCTAIRWRC